MSSVSWPRSWDTVHPVGQRSPTPWQSIIVATIIAYNGVRLSCDNFSFLIGRSPGKEFLSEVERLARSGSGRHGGPPALRAEYVGPNTVHAGMHVEVQRGPPSKKRDPHRRARAGTDSPQSRARFLCDQGGGSAADLEAEVEKQGKQPIRHSPASSISYRPAARRVLMPMRFYLRSSGSSTPVM